MRSISTASDKPDTLELDAYAEAASLDHLTLSAGDHGALLKGTRLDEVAKATLNGITWTPAGLTRVQDFDQLALNTEASTLELDPAGAYSANVLLRDGSAAEGSGFCEPAASAGHAAQQGRTGRLDWQRLRPSTWAARMMFRSARDWCSFSSQSCPQNFPRNQNVEVAALDGSFRTVLSLADGSLMLEDSKTALGTVEPLARFGASAFGPVRARAVSANGVAGDWMPLGTLVRIPAFKELRCTARREQALHPDRNQSLPCCLDFGRRRLLQSNGGSARLHGRPTGGAASRKWGCSISSCATIPQTVQTLSPAGDGGDAVQRANARPDGSYSEPAARPAAASGRAAALGSDRPQAGSLIAGRLSRTKLEP